MAKRDEKKRPVSTVRTVLFPNGKVVGFQVCNRGKIEWMKFPEDPDLYDKIATEEDAEEPEKLLEYLQNVGHPALEMDPLF